MIYRKKNGQYKQNNKLAKFLIKTAPIYLVLCYGLWTLSASVNAEVVPEYQETVKDAPSPCLEVSEGYWDCTEDLDTLKEWNGQKETFKAVRTWYDRASSCHNPRGNECLTASGNDTKEGSTVACPRFLPLGTVLDIPGVGIRTCDDRYSTYLDAKRGLPSVDIFFEDGNSNIPGYTVVEVTIISKP